MNKVNQLKKIININVLIVDDHKILRAGLLSLLNNNYDIQVVGEAENGKEAISLVRKLRPDIVIMDLDMPIMNGLDASRAILEEFPETRILVLTMLPDHEYIQSALKAGVKGYLEKDTAADTLVEAVYDLSKGKTYYSKLVKDSLTKHYIHDQNKNKKISTLKLPSRLSQVLKLISDGKEILEISKTLQISVMTVLKHRESLCKALGFINTSELVRYALRNDFGSDTNQGT